MKLLPRLPRLALPGILIALSISLPGRAQKISEVVFSHAGPDDHEYIEIFGSPTTSYSAYRILEVDGGGVIQHVFTPGTTNGGGFWTTGYMTTTLEQPVFTVLLVNGFSGSVGADLDTNNDGTLDLTPWTALVDSVAFTDGTAGLRTYSTTVLGPNFDGNPAVPGGASRFPYFKDTDAATDWKRNDFDGEGLPGFTGTLVPGEARNTPGWPTTVTLTDYYASVDTSSQTALRTTLHALIKDHIRYPYSASSTDTWDILESADQDPNNANNVLDIYKNESYVKFGGGTGPYNREHSWPNSYGFNDQTGVSPYTDCHHLFLSEVGYNSSRGNRPFLNIGNGCSSCTRFATVANDGYGGVSGPYPSDSNWQNGPDGNSGAWEVWSRRKGDIARAQLYMDVRYEGGTHSVTGESEKELILTDNLSLLVATTGQTGYMGKKSDIVAWHQADPPDNLERRRNDIVASYQGNRNPFIDHPEWVDCLFNGNCSSCSASATVSGSATICAGASTQISATLTGTGPWNLTWSDGFNQTSIPSSPATRTVSPSSSTTYTVTTVADATCSGGSSSGSATVTVRARPTAAVSGTSGICPGGSAQIQAALTGTAPWNLTWSDGFSQSNVSTSPATRTVSPSSNTTYSVTSISDANCTGTASGSATISVGTPPSAVVSGSQTVCAGASATISATLTGTAPFSLTWSDGFTQPNVNSSPATRAVNPSVTTTYTLTAISDAFCAGTSMTGSAVITTLARPVATVSGTATICTGGSTSIQATLSGTAPWTVTWSDGHVQSGLTVSPASRTVSPANSTTYTVTSVVDANCSGNGTGSAVVTVAGPGSAAGIESPADGTTGFQGSYVSWTHTGTGPYDVYFDTVNPPQKLLTRTNQKKASLPVLFPSMSYYWKVVVAGACGTPSSPIATFQTGPCAWTGVAPELASPSSGATGLSSTVLLTWTPVAGAAHYEVDLGTSNPPLRKYRTASPFDTSLEVKLNPGTTYYWRVVAFPICGNSGTAVSQVRGFTTAPGGTSLSSVQPAFVNRWVSSTTLSGTGSGILGSSALFLEAASGRAGTFSLQSVGPTSLSGSLALAGAERADFYDAGLSTGGIEVARLLQAVVVRAFTDVTENDWYFETSARIVEAGIMEADADPGVTGPQFRPTAALTRAEMAVYLAGAYQWWRTRSTALEPATCVTPDFPDVPCSHPNWLAIHWIKTWGVTVGSPCNEGGGNCYFPNNPLNRAEMMTFMERLKQGAALPGLLAGPGEFDPGCAQPYPACSGWTDPGMQLPGWPRREFNIAFADRLTNGCLGSPGNGLTACVFDPLTRDQIGALLARQLGLVPTP